jgi:hypothetical protein
MSIRFVATFLIAGITLTLFTRSAAALDKQGCYDAFELGQKQRQKGQMRDANESYLQCARAECPVIVQKECVSGASDIQRTIPTVTLSAVDERGKDLFDVRTFLDGKRISDRLDGKAIGVDPGPHVFRFEITGRDAIEERVLVKEGEKNRAVVVSWTAAPIMRDAPKTPDAAKPTEPITATTPSDAPITEPKTKGVSPLPIIVLGVGAAVAISGVVLLATAPAFPEGECVRGGKCTFKPVDSFPADKRAAESTRQADVLAQAASSDNSKTAGLVLLIAGSAVAVGGAVWLVVDLMGKKKTDAAVKPWSLTPTFGLGTAGLAGTF